MGWWMPPLQHAPARIRRAWWKLCAVVCRAYMSGMESQKLASVCMCFDTHHCHITKHTTVHAATRHQRRGRRLCLGTSETFVVSTWLLSPVLDVPDGARDTGGGAWCSLQSVTKLLRDSMRFFVEPTSILPVPSGRKERVRCSEEGVASLQLSISAMLVCQEPPRCGRYKKQLWSCDV